MNALLAAFLTVVSVRTIPPAAFSPASAPAAQVVPLSLVVEDGSAWNEPGRLEGVLGKGSAIFGRCGVSLGETQVVTARWSPAALKLLNDENPYKAPPQSAVLADPAIPARRPVAFLFGPSSVASTAKAYNLKTVKDFETRWPEAARMLNTFWITFDQETRRKPDLGPGYSVFAHELTHLLGNLPHTPEYPNLMTDAEGPNAKSGDLTVEQCAEVRKLYGLP